jgi:general secretion pathway protein K
VLIAVLWFLALLGVLVFALANTVRLDVQAKANLQHQAQAEVLADGITLSVAAYVIEQLSGDPNHSLPTNGTLYRCKRETDTIDITVTDVAGLIDLNAASSDLLARVLTGIGVLPLQAQTLAAAIADFRNVEEDRFRRVAKIEAYRAAGRSYGPKQAPFESVEELDQVLGMTPDILARLRGLMTVYSRSPGLDIQLAPPALVMALSRTLPDSANPSETAVESLRRRLADQFQSPSGSRSRIQTVTVGVTIANGGRFRRSAVVELSDSAQLGFILNEWKGVPERSVTPISMPPKIICPIL